MSSAPEHFVPTDAMSAAAGYVAREFGHGYSVRVVTPGFTNALFELRAGDGSRRCLAADRYGNVVLAEVHEDAERITTEGIRRLSEELHRMRDGWPVYSDRSGG